MGSLLPTQNEVPKFLQVYFIADYLQQFETRMDHTCNLDKSLVTELQNLLHAINPFVSELKSAFEFVTSANNNQYNIVIHADRKENNEEHRGRYNEMCIRDRYICVRC